MKLVYPKINRVFDTDIDKVNTIIIEDSRLLYEILTDIHNQIEGNEGHAVISDKNKEVSFPKSVEMLTQFVPFEISKKSLITKIITELEKRATADEMYIKTMELMTATERLLDELSYDMNCEPIFTKMNIGAVIKAVGLELNEEYDSIGEKMIDYFELVEEYDHRKMFITYNLRSFMQDEEVELFLNDVIKRGICLIMLESYEHKLLPNEQRVVIDNELCEIVIE